METSRPKEPSWVDAPPWELGRGPAFEVRGSGNLPVLVHVPHAGLAIPDEVRQGITLDDDALATELRRITDHRTDILAQGAIEAGGTAFVNRMSRLVVDPERFPDPAEEVMEQVGMGAVYTATTQLEQLRSTESFDREELLHRWFHPYARALTDTVDAVLDRHARCSIIDLHSYPAHRLPYEVGEHDRPDVCVGTDANATPESVARTVEEVARSAGLETARNTPFAGTYVPLAHLENPAVTSVMLEVRRDCYLDEDAVAPTASERDVRAFVTAVTKALAAVP